MPIQTAADSISNSAGSPYGFKNRVINGAMNIWQRGTSFANPTVSGGNFYTADRWAINRAGDVSGATVSQSTDVPSGFQYSLKLQRTAGDTSTAGLYLFNSNETANTLDLAGNSVTISFWVKTGANYSGGTLSVQGYWGTGTDQRVFSYTGLTNFINTTQAITSTWTRYSFTAKVGVNSTEVGFQLFWTPTGTAGADDSIYITGCQLEKGSQATAFDYRPYGTELQLCQRYYQKLSGFTFIAGGGATGGFSTVWQVPMRTTPSVSQTGVLTIEDMGVADITQSSLTTSIAIRASNRINNISGAITLNNFSGLTTYRPYLHNVNHNGTDNYVTLSAEL
jgi:hypothetical protein